MRLRISWALAIIATAAGSRTRPGAARLPVLSRAGMDHARSLGGGRAGGAGHDPGGDRRGEQRTAGGASRGEAARC
jgi:hypothetical protein